MGILPYIQIILAVLLIAGVLMQQSEAGLGAVFGGGGSEDEGVRRTRRGFEKKVFDATKIIAILFVLSLLTSILIS